MSDARTFSAYGDTFIILRTPPTLLISELARTNTGAPEAVGVIAEFFETVLGPVEYHRFKKASYAYDADSDADEAEQLGQALAAALEAATEVPTK